jgi:hypothetical protein
MPATGTIALLLQVAGTTVLAAPTRELRDAQARMESVRRMHLPVTHFPASRCDVRIGRFCYWYDSTPPPALPEAPQVRAERERFLSALEEAAVAHPRDPWIPGQRVRYLLDAGRAAGAARVPCGAMTWWCAALRGLALHVKQDYAAADSAYSAALAHMPRDLRCEWLDLSPLLEDGPAREMADARGGCERRRRLSETVWRLAQPLWLTAGNDARTEHLARRTMDVIFSGSAVAHGSRWGGDTRELLLRYGWSETHTRSPPAPGSLASAWSVLGHGREPSWHLVPAVDRFTAPWIASGAWDLRAPLARTRYAPRHLTALVPLEHQLVRIPWRDSMRVVAAHRAPWADAAPDSIRAALFAAAWDRDGALGTPVRGGADGAGVVVAMDTVVVSIETLDRGTGRAARARYSLAPLPCAGHWCVSDLLLFDPEPGRDSLPLARALERATPPRMRRGTPVGVWWHVRGAPDATAVAVSVRLTLEPAGTGVLRRAAEQLGLARRRGSVRMRWAHVMRSDSASAHVTLGLPARAGRYRLLLTVQPPGGDAVNASRELEILP